MSDEIHDEDNSEEAKEEVSEVSESQRPLAKVSGTVVPFHAATAPLKRGPGRPRKVHPKPSTDDLLYHAEMTRQKAVFICNDPLVRSTEERQEALEVLQRVRNEVAREAASLHFQRNEDEKYGKDTSQLSSRRIAALREVANLELEIRKLGATIIDLKGERFQKIFAFFLETVKSSAEEVLSPEMVDILFNRLETKLEGWEEKAQTL